MPKIQRLRWVFWQVSSRVAGGTLQPSFLRRRERHCALTGPCVRSVRATGEMMEVLQRCDLKMACNYKALREDPSAPA